MDDCWFGARSSDRAGLVDWTPRPTAFPEGLRPLADHVHGLGMRFGLWVEPELVNPDSELFREGPEWVLHLPDRTAHPLRNQLVLDFPLGTHRVLDELCAARPALRIEACSGGGGRVDLASLARTDQAWTSDDTDAVDRLAIQHGFSQLYPAQVMGAWVTDSPNPHTRRAVPLPFRFHSAMAGALSIGGDLTRWSAAELAEAAAYVARYKAVRSTVLTGHQYRLGSPSDGAHAVQYVARDGGESVVLQWRAGPVDRAQAPRLRLRGLDPQAAYRVDDDGGTLPTGTVRSGAALAAHGLPARLPPGDHASRMLALRRAE
ncbi:alpha-galactosidase [Streptomyces cyaneofuscatus]|uniref:alpha-galactosidase n=1 Tax=Streptomyces cyaneofuscatus TaxID=66883 RepID=UPI003649B72F